MDHQQKRKQPCITTKTHDKNSKRRELYRDMATTKKNALLLQRRLKKREATTNRLLGSRKSINLAESMSAIQENVIVGGSCSISKIGSTSSTSGAFFVDGPGGTEKTFLYRALLATVRSIRYIALTTATSGVAASILPGGRTAHSHFKIPIDIDEHSSCNISKQSALVGLIREAKLIIWDEVWQ
ncbi:uncharacterized protein LOC107763530 isoform X2 [Nicotiana tabacum]|uniref:Uncharacterized protein LOC107763530 isoform X2 n=1 Tax=Nicotiana tabacum TaxID=4097 RepID=A0AC58UUQ9_TOBAC